MVTIGSMVPKQPEPLEYGVPHSSVPGSVLFSMYMASVENPVRHELDSVIYADDSQLYVACGTHTDYSVVATI